MEVASLENCKRLYELSGWKKTEHVYSSRHKGTSYYTKKDGTKSKHVSKRGAFKLIVDQNGLSTVYVPAYDLGYLLRKLPDHITKGEHRQYFSLEHTDTWDASYSWYDSGDYFESADSPEDAVCLLAIKLFESDVLKREGNERPNIR